MNDDFESEEDSPELLAAKEKLEEAIKEYNKINAIEHIGHDSPVLMGWVVALSTTTFEEYGKSVYYSWSSPRNQPLYHTAGLIDYVRNNLWD